MKTEPMKKRSQNTRGLEKRQRYGIDESNSPPLIKRVAGH